MGSSGSGRISDYPGSSSSKGSGGGGHSHGGNGGEDRCAKAFSARLEDIEQSDYYRAKGSAPPIGTQVRVAQRKRLVAETSDGESVGNLPTSHNYLAGCMKAGWSYAGVVRSSTGNKPVAGIAVDFVASLAK